MQADGLGVDVQFSGIIKKGESDIGLDRQVRLAAGVVVALDHHLGLVEDGLGVLALGDLLDVIDVRRAGVDLDGVGLHRLGSAHVGGQNLEFDLDLLRGLAGVLLGIGADNGNGVTVLEHLGVAQDRPVPAIAQVGGEGDQAGDAVLALDVLVGNHLEHAGHLLRLAGVDGEDVGMGDLGLNQGELQSVLRQLQSGIRTEVPGAGDLGGGARPRHAGAQHLAVLGQLEGQVLHADLTLEHPHRILHRVHQHLVTSAAAGVLVLLEPVADVVAGRIRVAVDEGLGGDDEARGTEAALGATVDHPSHLQGVQVLRGADALDGGDGRAVGHALHLGDTGADQLAVHDHVAGTALALTAADLGAGEAQTFADDIGEQISAFADHRTHDPVDV